MNKKVVGNNITNLRKKNHMTQSELAEKLNVSDKTVSRWERGECIPGVSLMREISSVFNVSIEDIEKSNDALEENLKKNYSQTKKKRRIIILPIMFVIVIFITLILFMAVYIKNNYNKFQVYEIVSRDKNNRVEGKLIVTPEQDMLDIFSVSFSNERLLNEKIYAFYYAIEIDEKIMYESGMNIDNYKYDSKDKLYLFSDMLKEVEFHLKGNENSIRKITIGNPRIIIKYVTENFEKKEITIYLDAINEFSNNKIFYKQKNEDSRINARDRAYSLSDGRYYQLGYINVEKISNVDEFCLNVGDKVDIYVYSDEIDSKISETPWLSNVLVFMITDEDDNTYKSLNLNTKELYWLEPVESGKIIHARTVAELPGYKIEIKVNNTIANDEIKVNKELDKIIAAHFITIPEDY